MHQNIRKRAYSSESGESRKKTDDLMDIKLLPYGESEKCIKSSLVNHKSSYNQCEKLNRRDKMNK